MYVQLDPNVRDMKSFLADVKIEKTQVFIIIMFIVANDLQLIIKKHYSLKKRNTI